MSKLKIKIDSTCMGESACILRWYRHVVEGYTGKASSPSLVYGIAVHKFIDMMFKTDANFADSINEAKKLFLELPCAASNDPKKAWQRDVKHLISTCHYVWITQIMEDSVYEVLKIGDKPTTELTFDFPFYEDDNIIVNLCGTIDTVGKIVNGIYCIRDWKTTSSWDLKNYFKQYELSKQLRIYTLACKLMSHYEPESVLGKIGAGQMGAMIDCIALKSDINGTSCMRSPVYQYTDKDIDEIHMLLDDQCRRMSNAVKTGYLPKEGIINGTCDGKWGLCQFWNVCKSNDQVANLLLSRDFNRRDFNPLQYNG